MISLLKKKTLEYRSNWFRIAFMFTDLKELTLCGLLIISYINKGTEFEEKMRSDLDANVVASSI